MKTPIYPAVLFLAAALLFLASQLPAKKTPGPGCVLTDTTEVCPRPGSSLVIRDADERRGYDGLAVPDCTVKAFGRLEILLTFLAFGGGMTLLTWLSRDR